MLVGQNFKFCPLKNDHFSPLLPKSPLEEKTFFWVTFDLFGDRRCDSQIPRVWEQGLERGLTGSVRILEVTGSRVGLPTPGPVLGKPPSKRTPSGFLVAPAPAKSPFPGIGAPTFFSIPSKDKRDGGGRPASGVPGKGGWTV